MTDPADTNVYADRLPTDDELARQSSNTRNTFKAGDLVIDPARWGRAAFVVDATHERWDRRISLGIATRVGDRIHINRNICGAVEPSRLVRVCRHCLKIDPLHHIICGDDPVSPPPSLRVPVTLTDINGRGGKAVTFVDTTDTEDAVVIIDVAGRDLVGIDLIAGTVGIWVGDDPENREWRQVDQFAPPEPQAVPDGCVADADGDAAVVPTSEAEQAFTALTRIERAALLRGVFEILEYGPSGKPEQWSADTAADLGTLFGQFRIAFTNPNGDDASDPDETTVEGLVWESAGTVEPGDQTATSKVRFMKPGMAAHYAVCPATDGGWQVYLIVTVDLVEIPEAGLRLGYFDDEAAAKLAANQYEYAAVRMSDL